MIEWLLHSGSGVPSLIFVGAFAGLTILLVLLADKITKRRKDG